MWYQNQVRRASFKQNWASYVQLNHSSVKTQKGKTTSESDWKMFFFLSNLLKTLFSFTFAISQIQKEHFLCKTISKKLKKQMFSNILVHMGYTLEKS